tara:strand:- start:40 stop:168 length:129 start_codon:yes stop_codon:yes gene_type:complete
MSDWFDHLNPIDAPQYQCCVCEKPLYQDKQYCSNNCFEADMM